MKAKINGKEVDLEKAFPIKVRDLRYLGQQNLVDANGNIELTDLNKLLDFGLYLAQKANPDVTPDDYDDMNADELNRMLAWIGERTKREGNRRPPSGTKSR